METVTPLHGAGDARCRGSNGVNRGTANPVTDAGHDEVEVSSDLLVRAPALDDEADDLSLELRLEETATPCLARWDWFNRTPPGPSMGLAGCPLNRVQATRKIARSPSVCFHLGISQPLLVGPGDQPVWTSFCGKGQFHDGSLQVTVIARTRRAPSGLNLGECVKRHGVAVD
jgi:hypothetical protein